MDGMTVGKAGEFGLIRRIMHDFIYRPELVVVGPVMTGRCTGRLRAMTR